MFIKFSQQKPLYFLSFGELCERLSFYGMQNILVLYLIHQFKVPDNINFGIYGAYVTFAFALPVLGGFAADRWLGHFDSIILGAVLLILGNLLATIPNFYIFCLSLAIIVTGIGFYKPNSTTLVGHLYSPENPQRERGYTLFYLAMNIGATIGAIIFGLLSQWLSWNKIFIVSSILIFIAVNLLLRILSKEKRAMIFKYQQHPQLQPFRKKLIYLLIPVIIALITTLMWYPALMQYFVLTFIIGIGISLITTTLQYSSLERRHILAIIIFITFNMFFFGASLLVGSSINLFIARDVNHTIGHWVIPTIMFTSLYPLAVIMMAPIITPFWQYLANKNQEPSAPTKLAIGLGFAGLAFVCFRFAAEFSSQSQTYLTLGLIVLGNICLGTGELALTPALMSTISRLAPAKMQATLMGTWFLFIALGGYLSSFLGKLTTPHNQLPNASSYAHSFGLIAIAMGFIAFILMASTPFLKKLMMQPHPSPLKLNQDSVVSR